MGSRVETRAANRQALLDAARALIAEAGAAVPVGAIAEAAGLTTGAIYSIFEGKNDLLVALFEREIEGLAEDFARVDDELDLGTTVGRYVDAWFDNFATESAAQTRFEFQVFIAATTDERLAARIGAMLDQEAEQLAALLTGRQVEAEGARVTTPQEAKLLATALKATITGFSLRNIVVEQDREVVRRACLALTRLVGE